MYLKKLVSSKKETEQKYWSIIIEPEWVQSGIWTVRGGEVEILSFSKPLPWSGNENLVDAIDSSLSLSVDSLPDDDLEISETVFGLSLLWLNSVGEIRQEYQDLIKDICNKLSLKPVGFVVLSEALAFYFKSEEKVPLSAIVVGLGEKSISVSLFVEGKSMGEVIVSRSLSVVDDFVEGLSRLVGIDSLPPRILIFDGREGELSDISQELVSANWSEIEGLTFLHPPKVEIVDFEKKIRAVSLAGGVEIMGTTPALTKAVEEKFSFGTEGKADFVNDNENEKPVVLEKSGVQGDNFSSVDSGVGFVINKDIKEVGEMLIGKTIPQEESSGGAKNDAGGGSLLSVSDLPIEKGLLSKRKRSFSGLLIGFSRFFGAFLSGSYKTSVLIGFVSLILIFVGFFAIWRFLPKASVTVYLSPKKIESKQEIIFDTTAEAIDVGTRTVPARVVTKEESGEKTIPTTGTKLTGEKAKGKVVIYRTGPELSLKRGLKIQSSSGLIFFLDEDVTVASGSASSPTKSEVQVTAADIGSEYNLASGESFSVGNFPRSEIEAKNEEPFSGGSSREISSVSEEDYKTVLLELKKELKDKVVSEMKSSISGDEYLIVETLVEKERQKNYDHKLGDEASSLKLSLIVEFSAFSFKKLDMFKLSEEVLKDQIASGYVLREGQLSLNFDLKNIDESRALLSTSFFANLLPVIDTEGLKKKIAGRRTQFVKDYLIKESGYEKVRIEIEPRIFAKLDTLPRLAKNIEVQFEASR